METGRPGLASVPVHIRSVAERRMDIRAPLTAVYIHTLAAAPPHLASPSLLSKETLPLLTLHIPGGAQTPPQAPAPSARPKSAGKHVCPHCGRDCMKPSVLEKHLRCHTGERPFPCSTCGVSFKTQSNLYKHRRTQAHARLSSESEPSSLDSSGSRDARGASLSLDESGSARDQEEVNGGDVPGKGEETIAAPVGRHLPLQRQEAMLVSKRWASSASPGASQSHGSTDSGFSESSELYPSPGLEVRDAPAEQTPEVRDAPAEQRTLEERISQLISENSLVVEDKHLEHVRPRKTVLSKQGSIDLPVPYTYRDSFHFDMKISPRHAAPLTRSHSLPFSVALLPPERSPAPSYARSGSSGQIDAADWPRKPASQHTPAHRPLVRQTAVDSSSLEEAFSGDSCDEPISRKVRRRKPQKFFYKWYTYRGGTFKRLYGAETAGDSPASAATPARHHADRPPLASVDSSRLHSPVKPPLRRNLSLSVLPLATAGSLLSNQTEAGGATSQPRGAPVPSDRKKQRTEDKTGSSLETLSEPNDANRTFRNFPQNPKHAELRAAIFLPSTLSAEAPPANIHPPRAAPSSFLPKYQLRLPNAPPDPHPRSSQQFVAKGSEDSPPDQTPQGGNLVAASLATPLGQSLASSLTQRLASPLTQSLASPLGQSLASSLGQSLASSLGQSLASPLGQSLASPLTLGQSLASPLRQSLASSLTLGQSLASPLGQSLASPLGQSLASPLTLGQSLASPLRQSLASSLTLGQSLASPLRQSSASSLTLAVAHRKFATTTETTSCLNNPTTTVPKPPPNTNPGDGAHVGSNAPFQQNVFHVHTADLQICLQIISDEQLALIAPQIDLTPAMGKESSLPGGGSDEAGKSWPSLNLETITPLLSVGSVDGDPPPLAPGPSPPPHRYPPVNRLLQPPRSEGDDGGVEEQISPDRGVVQDEAVSLSDHKLSVSPLPAGTPNQSSPKGEATGTEIQHRLQDHGASCENSSLERVLGSGSTNQSKAPSRPNTSHTHQKSSKPGNMPCNTAGPSDISSTSSVVTETQDGMSLDGPDKHRSQFTSLSSNINIQLERRRDDPDVIQTTGFTEECGAQKELPTREQEQSREEERGDIKETEAPSRCTVLPDIPGIKGEDTKIRPGLPEHHLHDVSQTHSGMSENPSSSQKTEATLENPQFYPLEQSWDNIIHNQASQASQESTSMSEIGRVFTTSEPYLQQTASESHQHQKQTSSTLTLSSTLTSASNPAPQLCTTAAPLAENIQMLPDSQSTGSPSKSISHLEDDSSQSNSGRPDATGKHQSMFMGGFPPADFLPGGVRPVQSCYSEDTSSSDDEGKLIIEL